jgi:hypothetical protein
VKSAVQVGTEWWQKASGDDVPLHHWISGQEWSRQRDHDGQQDYHQPELRPPVPEQRL